ncbi:MAG: GHMP kinase [Kiritimatiellaeota bacterium]|nr:GHMP kinase [Kiritimatiellota bacterium]
MKASTELFVPGRVCLFGEHSDWAGSYRRFNSALTPGRVVISGTNQGVYARVGPRGDALVVRSTLPDGTTRGPVRIPMTSQALLECAESGDFFSYAAGVAYTMLTFYNVDGLEIDNYRTDLPVQKGLSSSAAFCVLVARAFNRVYDLKLTVRAEMEAAYQGEILTPSRCGRMDQGCAYGRAPVLMVFDGDLLTAERLPVGSPMHLLVADLNGSKDTIRILAELNRAYPFAEDEPGRRVQEYLGPVNAGIVDEAVAAIRAGDARRLGRLMNEAQAAFDEAMIPACPSELEAPRLHAVLADPTVRRLVWGGKGVGSQGDGCVQFVARGPEARAELAAYLKTAHGLECFELDLAPAARVRKAVVPVAGFGTRLFPASKAVKKELFPVVTPDGVAKPVLLVIVEEALAAGIEEIALIVREGDGPFFEEFFSGRLPPAYGNHLSEKQRIYAERLREIGRRITCIAQSTQEGFGHAVYCAREWVGDTPFLLMLGDHVYRSDTETPCARQLLDAFKRTGGRSVVGVYPAPLRDVVHYGTVAGEWVDSEQRLLQIGELAEKPSEDYASNNLVTPGVDSGHILCISGQYVLTPEIFELLGREIDADAREAGEIQLTTALESLRKTSGVFGYRIAGRHFDIGLPEAYVETVAAFRR